MNDKTASIRVSSQAMASLKVMRKSTGAGYRFLIDSLIEDRRRINAARIELDKMFLEAGASGDRAGIEAVKSLKSILKA